MSRLGGFDSLEVALLGEVGSCTIGKEVRGAGFSCGGVKFFSEEGKQGGPPGLQAVGRVFGGGRGGKKSGVAREVLVEPGFKGTPGGERSGLRKTAKSFSSGARAGQSVRTQLGEGGGGEVNGCESIIWTGTWSEPVEGRVVSHVWQKEGNEGEVKERSSTEGQPELPRVKRV